MACSRGDLLLLGLAAGGLVASLLWTRQWGDARPEGPKEDEEGPPQRGSEEKKKKKEKKKKEKKDDKPRSGTLGPAEAFKRRAVARGVAGGDESEITRRFPRRFELFGHVVVVKLNAGVSRGDFEECAAVFAESFAPRVVTVVLLDTVGIGGELREPQLHLLWKSATESITMPKESLKYTLRQSCDPACVSPEDVKLFETCTDSLTFTTHIENGVRYSFDVSKVMFCSGNGTERMHFSTIVAKDEVVVDMFAGIGYFTIPLAMHGGPKVIHALEKNANSVTFLKYNAVQNKVSHVIRTYCGDNREVGSELCGKCDRVLMGYIPSCEEFLPRAVSFLKVSPNGNPIGTIHYHFLSDKNNAEDTVRQHVKMSLGEDMVRLIHINAIRIVKSYAPKRFHCVADLVFESSSSEE
ncbi:tRNA wybutosine-synthesizing protein 2 [Trypanosoma theileri]|uniref:tRNA wybutosine-synthesizing protein 2 n=1 Tax=Trypanosoma theileri TaxID=67003 RepID=A0A1X0P9M7_9TRYP|nr:tRNA wybutosine-synthesizing protein 2 [Trypanosoma theileri]ORC93299.1 tRNA wybutosine-synthesizing protein 2 [Trypanosoma theileri]